MQRTMRPNFDVRELVRLTLVASRRLQTATPHKPQYDTGKWSLADGLDGGYASRSDNLMFVPIGMSTIVI